MTWACITSNESHFIDQPFQVTGRAHHLLTENGWTPPRPTQGLFLCPDEEPMRDLTRAEADIALRSFASTYYDETERDGHMTVDNSEPRFSRFVRELSYKLDADFDKDYVFDVLHGFDDLERHANTDAEIDLTCAINKALDNTCAFGITWIIR